MSGKTSIQWTDMSWNPVTGCTKVSPGCDNCYAETFAERWRGVPGHAYEQGFDMKLWPDRLNRPYKWKNKMVFVNSMSDLFHRDIPDEYIQQVFKVMSDTVFCPHRNTYQVLTKRPERMRRLMGSVWPLLRPDSKAATDVVMNGIWLGTSVENEDYAWRANQLRQTPAAVRFLSLEPLLGDIPEHVLTGMSWVIVGGESGPGHRQMNLDWARNIRDRCEFNGIPFFFKQVGHLRPNDDMIPDDLRIREFPNVVE